VNSKNKQGLSALHVALQMRCDAGSRPTSADEIVHMLVKNGYNTDVNLPDARGVVIYTVISSGVVKELAQGQGLEV